VASGDFNCVLTVKDSYSPPEVISQPITFKISVPQLALADSLPSRMIQNRLSDSSLVAVGGTPPYTYTLMNGAIPGISSVDSATGRYAGTPTTNGTYALFFRVTDASSPPQTAFRQFFVQVISSLNRNDAPATATSIGNGFFQASISPYIDPPNGPPFPADHDYYKLSSVTGAVIRVDISARRNQFENPLDSVVEFLDSNGSRLTTCAAAANGPFNSPCINDDLDDSTTDSLLFLRVPGTPSTPATVLIHVFDWTGSARPDMTYSMNVSGLIEPLRFSTSTIPAAAKGLNFGRNVSAVNIVGTATYSIDSGQLPPGLSIDNLGLITGQATMLGDYSFVAKVTDSSSPPQVATQQYSIRVVDPIKITSAAALPAACLFEPYNFAVQTSGGSPPLRWSFNSNNWVAINLDFMGNFSGTPNTLGTFTGSLSVIDETNYGDSQNVSLLVKNCP
jgi:hypothetical protein